MARHALVVVDMSTIMNTIITMNIITTTSMANPAPAVADMSTGMSIIMHTIMSTMNIITTTNTITMVIMSMRLQLQPPKLRASYT